MQLKDLKTSLFGFNKNDVCEYISQLNTVYEEKERQIRQEQCEITEGLNRKNEDLNNSLAASEQEKTELIREKEALQKRTESIGSEIGELKLGIEEMRKLLTSVFENAFEQLDLFESKIDGLLNEQSGENEDEQ